MHAAGALVCILGVCMHTAGALVCMLGVCMYAGGALVCILGVCMHIGVRISVDRALIGSFVVLASRLVPMSDIRVSSFARPVGRGTVVVARVSASQLSAAVAIAPVLMSPAGIKFAMGSL